MAKIPVSSTTKSLADSQDIPEEHLQASVRSSTEMIAVLELVLDVSFNGSCLHKCKSGGRSGYPPTGEYPDAWGQSSLTKAGLAP